MILYDKDFKDFFSKFKNIVEEVSKGKIIENKFYGLKNLPEKINNHDTGLYMIVKFKCSPKAFKDINKYLMTEKIVLRYFVILT